MIYKDVKIVLVILYSRTKLRGIASGLVRLVSEPTNVVRILRQPRIALLLAASVLRLLRYKKLIFDSGARNQSTPISNPFCAHPEVVCNITYWGSFLCFQFFLEPL
jgi:hypothetical protein